MKIKTARIKTINTKLPSGKLKDQEKPDLVNKKVEFIINANFREIKIKGVENFKLIPAKRKLIFVPTHLSDFDMLISLYALSQYFHVAIVDSSTHHHLTENPLAYVGIHFLGAKNFYSVKYTKDNKGIEHGKFDPNDFNKMQKDLTKKKAIIFSAYYKGGHGWCLPNKGGLGAIYLAALTNALIVPVAINIKSKKQIGMGNAKIKTLLKRPRVEVIIGQPIDFPQIKNLRRITALLKKKKTDQLSAQETIILKQIFREINKQSNIVMQHLAKLLPKQKRGKWS
ncbi:MAG: hypothetical protein NTW06_02460 [Candidatus Falkowbacteria bacterium]|nr:hypothetical protein [Candidatus Falkowbacteria bacterium]